MSNQDVSQFEDWVFATFDTALKDCKSVGIACSGGGDSVALLRLLHRWGQKRNVHLKCVTVDHGLRAASLEEARFVKVICDSLKIKHQVLQWQGWDQKGNLQDQARQNRYRLLADWAENQKLDAVALGHTQDDAVETFLMRLARGSGVDGLSFMANRFERRGLRFVRPLLSNERDQLREYLSGLGQDWIDDPSNEDEKFDRVKIRKALPVLESLGIDRQKLVDTSLRMRDARFALEKATYNFAMSAAKLNQFGAIVIDRKLFVDAARDVQRRLLSHCLQFVSGAPYKIGLMVNDPIWVAIDERKTHSLSGCLIAQSNKDSLEVVREPSAMPVSNDFGPLYDDRWKISMNQRVSGVEIRPLGDTGVQSFRDWRDFGVSRASLMATPAIWCKGELLTAPLLDKVGFCSCQLVQSDHEFFTSIMTH